MTKKLSRKEIKQALEATPIEQILLGHNTGGVTLTAKQKAFAEEVAKGTPKAQAYRKAYPNKMTPQQQAHEGHKLANTPKIANIIDSIKLANEAQKYLLPAHLRTLAVQRLTELAIDPEIKPAQQLKALELIGKITEVALFTERREVIKVTDPREAREKLIESIKLALRSDKAQDADYIEAKQLQDELKRGQIIEHDASHYDDDQGNIGTETEDESIEGGRLEE